MQKLSALETFHSAINNISTDIEYTNKLKRYENFCNVANWDTYVKKDPEEIHDDLVFYINSQKKEDVKNRTIKSMMSSVYLMLEMNRVTLHKKILQKMIPFDNTIEGGKMPYTTDEVYSMINSTIDFGLCKCVTWFRIISGNHQSATIEELQTVFFFFFLKLNMISFA